MSFGWENTGTGKDYSDYTQFDATVGTNGDYPTIKNAVADGKRHLRIISDIEENADWGLTTSDNLYIFGKEKYTITLRLNYVVLNSVSASPFIYFENVSFLVKKEANTKAYFGYAKVKLENVDINSYDDTIDPESDFTIFGFNVTGSNININNGTKGVRVYFTGSISDINISANMPTTPLTILFYTNVIATNIKYTGSFPGIYGLGYNVSGTFENIDFSNVTYGRLTTLPKTVFKKCTNIPLVNSDDIVVKDSTVSYVFEIKNSKLINCNVLEFAYNQFFNDNGLYEDCIFPVATLMYITRDNLNFIRCKFNSDTIRCARNGFYADNLNITNSIINGNIEIYGDANNLQNNRITGGTIDIKASADKTIVKNNRTLIPIIYNGTNTESGNNILI